MGLASGGELVYARLVRAILLLLAAGAVTMRLGGSAGATEQTIVPLTPGTEQQLGGVDGPGAEQRVQAIDQDTGQVVGPYEPPSDSAKTASKVGQFVLGVTVAGVALAAMAASLIFL